VREGARQAYTSFPEFLEKSELKKWKEIGEILISKIKTTYFKIVFDREYPWAMSKISVKRFTREIVSKFCSFPPPPLGNWLPFLG
jgi:hypothetical protein